MLDEIKPVRQIWEWSAGSEKAALKEILEVLKSEWRAIERKPDSGSLMLCGIGISHSDVPALLAKMTSCGLDDPARIYDLLYGCRQIDLSVATYSQFATKTAYFAYPKSKAQLYQKYLPDVSNVAPAMTVWDSFLAEDFASIEARAATEVAHTVAIYKKMFDLKRQTDKSLERLKKLERKMSELSPVRGSNQAPDGYASPEGTVPSVS